jgi:hypothetical protein
MDIFSRNTWSTNHIATKIPPPPNVIPENMLGDFTLNGNIPLLYLYFNEKRKDNPAVHNTSEIYEQIISAMNYRCFYYYGSEGNAFFDAAASYSMHGKEVSIWGLTGCNCEAFAVWSGAGKVFVVEYNKPICDHEKIVVYSYNEFISNAIKTDFAISYSSFEHDGLGRYGDPLSPDGDLYAMRKVWDSVKDDGILFLGLPLGRDCLVWNAHRIYGEIRLPMMLLGWKLLDVFSVYNGIPFNMPLGEYRIQCLMVLKKITHNFPQDEYLQQPQEQAKSLMHSSEIFNEINKFVYKYKYNCTSINTVE